MYGANNTALNGTISGTVGGIPFTRTIDLNQTTTGIGDLIPQFAVRWNAGVNNYMVYLTGDIPVGVYSSSNLANIGLGHGAIDCGVGYTYFDEKTGREFSTDHMSIRVARHRRRPASRLSLSGRRHAGLSEPEGLRRIRQ